MTQALSDRMWSLLEACFGDDEQRRAIALRLGQELPRELQGETLQRVQFSVVRLIVENHDTDYADIAVGLATTDWRDALVAAGHGDIGAHDVWFDVVVAQPPRVEITEPQPVAVIANASGSVTCPNCGFRFKPSDANVWDGKKHKRCLQALVIE